MIQNAGTVTITPTSDLYGTYYYEPGTAIVLTPSPPGALLSWGGDCSFMGSVTNPCSLTVDADKTVIAKFH